MTRTETDLLLVFPPFWDAGHAYLSVPTLAAYLRSQGFAVEAADLNRDVIRSILSAESLEIALEGARAALEAMPCNNANVAAREKFRTNLEVCQAVWKIAGQSLLDPFVPGAPLPQTIDDMTAFRRKLLWAYRIASAPLYPLSLTLSGLQLESLDRLSTVMKLVEKDCSIPGACFLANFAEQSARRGFRVIGLSVAGPSQMAPALFLARCFKQLTPSTIVCVGGPQIPYTIPALRNYHGPFKWVDAFVSGEGELPLRDLLRAARTGATLDDVRGLHLLRDGELIYTGIPKELPLTELPPPDFRGFEPESYLANDGTVALTFARGCSWSRCSFCTQFVCFAGYRAMQESQVKEHLLSILRRYPIKTIHLNDENLTPRRLLSFGRLIQTHAPYVRWQGLARYCSQLARPEVAQQLAASGCRMLCLGLESASESVLKLNNKGIRPSVVPKVMQTLHEAGIWLHTFVIFGLPGETRERAVETIRFLHKNKEHIDSISPTTFRMERLSPIAEHPSSFGIVSAPISGDHFDACLPIQSTTWLSQGEAMVFLETLIKILLGGPQCPIEQGDLTGQMILDLIARIGTRHLREVMRCRGLETSVAERMFEDGDQLFRDWVQRLAVVENSEAILGGPILALPARGLFVEIERDQRIWLKLRSIGVPTTTIGRDFGHLRGKLEDQTEFEWGVEIFILSILGTRIVQEALPSVSPQQTKGNALAFEAGSLQ